MAQESFRKSFVTNNGSLLAGGQTVDALAIAQLGILDGNTYVGTTTPTYAKNKALYFVWGTPDPKVITPVSGTYSQNEYSKLIKGKLITGFTGKKAQRGQHQVITVGWSGDVSDTDTLSAKPGEIKKLYLKLSGNPIDKLFSKQGLVREYVFESKIVDDCTDTCVNVDPRLISKSLADQINSDPIFVNTARFVKVSELVSCSPSLDALPSIDNFVFQLRVPDTRDDVALGIVQAQFPTLKIKRVGTEGAVSVYEASKTVNSAPSNFSNVGMTLIPECDVCPSGYTKSSGGFAYIVQRQDSGSSANLNTLISDYSVGGAGESAARLNYEYGQSTYIIVSSTAINAPVGTDVLQFQGETRGSCVLTSPTSIPWTYVKTLQQYGKKYHLTIADSICGTNRLADIQAALPSLTVTIVNAGGTCVHTYETTVYSQAVAAGCSVDILQWIKPQSFEGVEWIPVADEPLEDGQTCKVGLKIEVAFVDRITNECTYDYFPYEIETVHVQASTFNPDYNGPSEKADTEPWVVKQIQAVKFPAGVGSYVRKFEKETWSYSLKERSFDPVVRDNENYSFQARTDTYYDEYVLSFDFQYKVGGWSQTNTDSYRLHFFFPEGQGKNFEAAINGYLASANINIDPVVL